MKCRGEIFGLGYLLGSSSVRHCFLGKNRWVHRSLLQKTIKESEHEVEEREGRGGPDEPIVENRARNDSGKGTNPNFCFTKKGGERDGLVCRQG